MKVVAVMSVILLKSILASQEKPAKQTESKPLVYETGSDIALKCLKKKSNQLHADHPSITWEFFPCGPTLGKFTKLKCETARTMTEYEAQWTTKCQGNTKSCNSHEILNATSNDSGLYRCLMQSSNLDASVIIRLHEIKVIDFKMYQNQLPEILEGDPTDLQTYEGLQLVLRCRVYSLMPLNITWLREVGSEYNLNKTFPITYNNKRMINLNSSGVVRMTDDIYLSKLIIPNSTEEDGGTYVCLAINYKGITFKEVYVNISRKMPLRKWDDHVGTSFIVLFFIPVALALIPLTIWVCYSKRRTWKAKKVYDNRKEYIINNLNYQVVTRNQTEFTQDDDSIFV